MSLALSSARREVKRSLRDLLEQKHDEICDVTFEIQTSADRSERIRGVRSLLALHSPVFKSMLFGQMKEAELDSLVIINDISPDTFRLLMSVCYGLKAELTRDNVVSVLYASKKYMVGALERACVDFIANNVARDVTHLAPVLSLLFQYGLSDTLDQVVVELRPKARDLIESPAFLAIPAGIVARIISDDMLKVPEELIWDRCVAWAEAQAKKGGASDEDSKSAGDHGDFAKEDYRYHLRPLVRHIRFPVMQKKALDKVKKSGLLTKQELNGVRSGSLFVNQERGFVFKFDIYNDAHVLVQQGKVLRVKPGFDGYVLFSSSRGFQDAAEWTIKVVGTSKALGVGVVPRNDTPANTWLAKLKGVRFYSFTGSLEGEDGMEQTSVEPFAAGDVIGVKLDFKALTVAFLKNGTFVGEKPLDPDVTYYPIVGASGNGTHIEL